MKALFLDPYHTGSHAAFARVLTTHVQADWNLLTLPGRHWKWRMRGSAVHFARAHRRALAEPYDLLITTSMLPLAELLGLCPALQRARSILYFHENQLAYPAREGYQTARDLHFGFTQLISALAADRVVFNSHFNQESFLGQAEEMLRRMPDAVPHGWLDEIRARSIVVGVPLELLLGSPPRSAEEKPSERRYGPLRARTEKKAPTGGDRSSGPVILWNHRWEHDKAPGAFFDALRALVDQDVRFRLIVCGQRFRECPEVFDTAREWLGDRVVHWGYAESRAEYVDLLQQAHIVVSTAIHEFFGVSVLEATHLGARPLVPDRLSYPELIPAVYRYSSQQMLIEQLSVLCKAWESGRLDLREDRRALTQPYGEPLVRAWEELIVATVSVDYSGNRMR